MIFLEMLLIWMSQGKGILKGFSMLSVKVISEKMTGLLE
jgi:hypothetical protein